MNQEMRRLQSRFVGWLRQAYGGRASAERIYQVGQRIRETAEMIVPDFDQSREYFIFREALDFTDGLHDTDAQKSSRFKEEVFHLLSVLQGN